MELETYNLDVKWICAEQEDYSLFTMSRNQCSTILLFYVDNILIRRDCLEEIKKVKDFFT